MNDLELCVVINSKGAFLCEYTNGVFIRRWHGEIINKVSKIIWLQ